MHHNSAWPLCRADHRNKFFQSGYSPGPIEVPTEKLRRILGFTSINYVERNHTLTIADIPLMEEVEKGTGQ